MGERERGEGLLMRGSPIRNATPYKTDRQTYGVHDDGVGGTTKQEGNTQHVQARRGNNTEVTWDELEMKMEVEVLEKIEQLTTVFTSAKLQITSATRGVHAVLCCAHIVLLGCIRTPRICCTRTVMLTTRHVERKGKGRQTHQQTNDRCRITEKSKKVRPRWVELRWFGRWEGVGMGR
jgi:hypothetical protein